MAPALRMRFRPLTPSAIVSIGLTLDLLIWVPVSVFEGNAAILAFHVTAVALGLVCVMAIERKALGVFTTALITRDVFTVLGWYTTTDSNRMYFLGTNEDSSRFWAAASLSYEMASESFEDPLFPRLNAFLHQTAAMFAEPSYLANTQAVLMAGVLMVLFATLLLQELYGWKVARLAGLVMALHPIMVAFSTGLMRDELIGMFGFLLLYAVSRIHTAQGWGIRLWMLGLCIACGVALAFLRSISLAGFTVAAVLMLVARTPHQPKTLSRNAQIWLFVCLAGLLAIAVVDRFDRFEGVLEYAIKARAGEGGQGTELNPDGITTKIAEVSPFLFALIAPLALLQPLPFYAWDPPDFLGGEPALMDVLLGFGGLTNQILFGFYIIGASHWVRTRDSFGVSLGLFFTLLTCTLALIGLGQLRMIMAHCYPFFIAGVAIAIVQAMQGNWNKMAAALATWLGSLAALYLAYLSYRQIGAAPFAAALMLLAGFGFFRLWSFARLTQVRSLSRRHQGHLPLRSQSGAAE